jgi:hypothetical protein
MNVPVGRLKSLLFLIVPALIFCGPPAKGAEEHVVTLPQLRQAVEASAQARQARIVQVEKFFSTPRVEKTLRSARIDPVQIRQAIPQLSDQELVRLSSQTQKIQNDFAAGNLSNQQITYILIAIGTALLVTIIFVAK